MNPWLLLAVAIVGEVVATSALKASAGFSRLGPSLTVILGYGLAFYCLSLILDSIPVGVAYAIWSGLGIVLVTAIAWWLYDQRLDLWGFIGIALIVSGVVVLNLLSKTSA